jgi:arginine decarboxylase
MIIQINSGKGTGDTEIAAFDEALHCAGIHNLNLLYLSSVIPTKSKIQEGPITVTAKHGDKG